MDPVFDPRSGKMVDPQTGLPVSGNYQPPARVSTLDQIFNGTGIPERATLMNEVLNPTAALHDAGKASETLFDPDTTGWGRVGAFGNMASNMAGVLAPAMAAKSVGGKPVDAIVEALTNYSAKPKMLADEFLADEFGGIKLYHGSPHDFDKFSMDKIGTGEGAQAYGHGLYFAEQESIAKGYKDALSGRVSNLTTPEGNAARAFDLANGDKTEAIRVLKANGDAMRKYGSPRAAEYDEAVKLIEDGFTGKGRLYEVEVNANPEDFLDWDAPFKDQPAGVKELAREELKRQGYLRPNDNGPRQLDAALKAWRMEKGGIADTPLQALLSGKGGFGGGSPEGISAALKERGIPGIKYLDAGSRTAGDGSRNYVVFDENLISIIKKYGVAGAAAMLGMSQADLEASMQPQSMRDVLQ